MHDHIHVDRAAIADADDLISTYGDLARLEAASRAENSRALGNVVHFCRWRQVERAIGMLSAAEVTGTVH